MKRSELFPKTLFLLSTLFIFTHCSKEKNEEKPSADFTADKTEYVEGETAVFTQQSKNAETFRWTLPDGATQTGETVSYLLPIHGIDAVLQIKLEVFSKSGTLSDLSVKNFPVKAATGNVMLWAYNSSYPLNFPFSITVKVDNAEVFKGNMLNTSPEPDCGPQPGCPYFQVKVGTHFIIVEPTMQSFTVQVTKNACIKVKT